MAVTDIREVAPGSVLAEQLLDGKGNVLLQRGAVLTAALIARLQLWQVEKVDIEGTAGSAAAGAARRSKLTPTSDIALDTAQEAELAILRDALGLLALQRTSASKDGE